MTGPIIPVELWPEDAEAIVWDSDGQSLELRLFGSDWGLVFTQPRIEMPAGWDWRVPVMRPTCKDSLPVAPAIDLEQFRQLAQGWLDQIPRLTGEGEHGKACALSGCGHALLALIDASKNSSLPHVGDTNFVVSQPSKGEGVAHD